MQSDAAPAAAAKISGNSRRMYLLATVPFFSDIAETGGLPHAPREWITEIVAGALIVALVRRMLMQQRKIISLARSDALTGLGNRRAFDEALSDECIRARRNAQPLTLVYIDLDHFKRVNDELGHDAGDQVLCQLAAAVRQVVRGHIDRAFRLGGDEFALLLPGSSAAQAHAVVDRIRDCCAGGNGVWRQGVLGISCGSVQLQAGESARDFVRRADQAMFQAKRTT